MRFITNKLGVVIVLVALIASLFIGVITNTTSETKTVTDYTYVADMSQTFPYTQEPNFINYNPISNYTGYALSDDMSAGVAYTEASSPSNYRMTTDRSTNSIILELSTITSDPTYYRQNSVCDLNRFEYNYVPGTPASYEDHYVFMVNPNVITLSGLIDTIAQSAPAGTNTITMRFMSGNTESVSGYGYDLNRVVYNNLNNTLMESLWRNMLPIEQTSYGSNYDYLTWVYSYHDTEYGPVADWSDVNTAYPITYNLNNNSAYINKNGAYQTIDVSKTYVLWKSSGDVIDAEVTQVATGGSGYERYYEQTTINADWTTKVYVTFDAFQQSYIKINDGVRINNTDPSLTTVWSNDNDNGMIDIVFGANNAVGMANTFTLNYEGGTTATVGLSRYDNGNVTLDYDGSSYNLGTWNYFLLRFDAMTGGLAAYPVTSFTNYTQFTASNTPLNLGTNTSLTIPEGVIESISWGAVTEDVPSFTFSVSDTVIRDTYQLLMINPSINIADFFTNADAEGWRLNFFSFSIIGDSMTINGQAFPVTNGKITVNNKSYRLTNIYVSYDTITDHIYLTFANERITIDLGEKVTSVVSMTGTWFFNTGYYDADIVQRTDTNIQWTKLPPMGTVSLVFIGITLILSAVAIKRIGFTLPDYIVTVTSLAVAFCLMEVFI